MEPTTSFLLSTTQASPIQEMGGSGEVGRDVGVGALKPGYEYLRLLGSTPGGSRSALQKYCSLLARVDYRVKYPSFEMDANLDVQCARRFVPRAVKVRVAASGRRGRR